MKRNYLITALIVFSILQLALPDVVFAGRHYGWQRDLQNLFQEFTYFIKHPPLWAQITFCSIGGISLVYGFAIYRFIVMLPGIIIGGLIGFAIGAAEWGNFIGVLLGLFCGGIGGTIAWCIHEFIIWMIGAFIGGILSVGVSYGIFHTEPNMLVVIIAGLIGGALLIFISKSIVIVKTSALGALLVMLGTGKIESLPIFILLFAAGLAIQFGVSKHLLKAGFFIGNAALSNKNKKRVSPREQLKPQPVQLEKAEILSEDSLKRMLYTLENCKDEITEMVHKNLSLAEIIAHFKNSYEIPEKVTLGYLEELAES